MSAMQIKKFKNRLSLPYVYTIKRDTPYSMLCRIVVTVIAKNVAIHGVYVYIILSSLLNHNNIIVINALCIVYCVQL